MSAARQALEFSKYSGAGNDFIIVDERREPGIGEASARAKALCRRGTSVGADGLVFVSLSDSPEGAVARMRLWNADGSRAEFSGNAARCVVRYLVDEGLGGPEVMLATDIGLVRGHVEGRIASVEIPGTAAVYPNRRMRVEGRDLFGTYVLVGVPFFAILHDDPDELPVRYLGRAIRRHESLQPAGANVDFLRVDDEQSLYFRVYERGVEDETLSSGTGSIAAALTAAAAGLVSSPVACNARGGTLTVRFSPHRPPPNPAPDTPTEPDIEEARPAPASDKILAGEPELFGDIRVEGDTRQVMTGTALAEALRLR